MNTVENIHGKRKRAEKELLKGKRIAIQLQTLIHNPVRDLDQALELTMQIVESFSNTISLLNSSSELTQIAPTDGGGSSCSAESVKKVKDRRGCYKRRKSLSSCTKVSKTIEDGRAWRKYGQKNILNSQNPRCYYRCTHKAQGCKATKQVQKIPEAPFLYHITYFDDHTCTNTVHHVYPDPVEPNLLSFQQVGSVLSTLKNESTAIISDHQVKEDYNFVMEAEESKHDPWEDILIEPDQYWFQEVGSSFHSCGSTSFNDGLDVEVDQLDDIENVHFD